MKFVKKINRKGRSQGRIKRNLYKRGRGPQRKRRAKNWRTYDMAGSNGLNMKVENLGQ